MEEITIIGAGNVGTTLGKAFAEKKYVIKEVYSRTTASSHRACAIIGAGNVIEAIGDLSPADIVLVATSDNILHTIGEELAQTNVVHKDTIVFHCSGATPSSVLHGLRKKGAQIASVHPIKTFTSPIQDATSFSGTWCGIEGDDKALKILEPLFQAIGGNTFRVDGERKILYHTAIVFICNYVFPIIEAGLQCYEQASVPREIAIKAVEPILHATVKNALRLGPGKAITGPIARGDDVVVISQLQALADFKSEYKTLYEILGCFATQLAVEKGVASREKIEAIRKAISYDLYMTTN